MMATLAFNELRKTIMKRSNLQKIYFLKRRPELLKKYKKQNNYYSRLYKKERKKFFSNFDSSKIRDNKTFSKTIKLKNEKLQTKLLF